MVWFGGGRHLRSFALALENLARRAHGQLVDEPDVSRVLVRRDALLDEVAQLLGVASALALSTTATATSSPNQDVMRAGRAVGR